MKVNFLFLFCCIISFIQSAEIQLGAEGKEKPKKIIALVSVRNEAKVIEQCLRALSYYVDGIIVLDDGSIDDTVKIIQQLGELPILKIICCPDSSWEHRSESFNKQTLLMEGRKYGGTHFVIIDADEMFTAPCKNDNYLKNLIYSLKAGQAIAVQMPHLWRGFEYYRDDHTRWSPSKCWCGCIFADDGVCDYRENAKKSIVKFIHINRLPTTRSCDEPDIKIENLDISLMHFRFVNWNNVMIKRAWYMCLEWVRVRPLLEGDALAKRSARINFFYTALEDFSEENMHLKPINPAWLDYPFLNIECFLADSIWRKNAVKEWFTQYGKEYFSLLDIWNVDWNG